MKLKRQNNITYLTCQRRVDSGVIFKNRFTREIQNFVNTKVGKIIILNEDCSTSKASYGWRS